MMARGPKILMSRQYSTRMLTVTIPLPLVYWLDHEDCRIRQEQWYILDNRGANQLSRLCRWFGSPFAPPKTNAGQKQERDSRSKKTTENGRSTPLLKHQSQLVMSPSNKLSPSSTRWVWLVHRVAKTVTSSQELARQMLHLPCLRKSGPQGSDKLQILNSNMKSLYCCM